MPLTSFQQEVLSSIAKNRDPESYVAGGTVLQHAGIRLSNDIDIFHDREERLAEAVRLDDASLTRDGFAVDWRLPQPDVPSRTRKPQWARRPGSSGSSMPSSDSSRPYPTRCSATRSTRLISLPTSCWPPPRASSRATPSTYSGSTSTFSRSGRLLGQRSRRIRDGRPEGDHWRGPRQGALSRTISSLTELLVDPLTAGEFNRVLRAATARADRLLATAAERVLGLARCSAPTAASHNPTPTVPRRWPISSCITAAARAPGPARPRSARSCCASAARLIW